jgi:hypothetical protein
MRAGLTFTPTDYDVFKRIPIEWWDEHAATVEIAQATGTKTGIIGRRIGRFVTVGVVERRGGRSLQAKTEIRRVGQ